MKIICYKHYPDNAFRVTEHGTETLRWTVDAKVFEMPSTAVFPYCRKPEKGVASKHSLELSKALYGALVQPSQAPFDVNTPLKLEEINESVHSLVSITHHGSHKSQSSEDEGFTEPETPGFQLYPTEKIWDDILDVSSKTFYTWECIGRLFTSGESLYLSEAGPLALDEIGVMKLQDLRLLNPTLVLPAYEKISEHRLIRDCLCCMLGISSTTFQFISAECRFVLRQCVHVSGISAEALTRLIEEFCVCGTNFERLDRFSSERFILSISDKGLVYSAFVEGVRRCLYFFHAQLLSILPRNTLLQLVVYTAKVRAQLRTLAELCCVESEFPFHLERLNFPTGIDLLSYLYNFTEESVGSDVYAVLLSLLRNSCIPYLRFLQKWVYEGTCEDPYEEFSIVRNDDHLVLRDHHYWANGFSMTTGNVNESVPLFLTKLATDIFVCGKSVDLIRLCYPQHHLCKGSSNPPPLQLTFSESQLENIDYRSAGYVARMSSLAYEKKMTWEQCVIQEACRRMNQAENAQRQALENEERIKRNMIDARIAVFKKKRLQMAVLQEQIQHSQERKKAEREKEFAEEQALQAKLEQQIAEDERISNFHRRNYIMPPKERTYSETSETKMSEGSESDPITLETSPESEMKMEVSPDSCDVSPFLEENFRDKPIALDDIHIEFDSVDPCNNRRLGTVTFSVDELISNNNSQDANILETSNTNKTIENENLVLNANLVCGVTNNSVTEKNDVLGTLFISEASTINGSDKTTSRPETSNLPGGKRKRGGEDLLLPRLDKLIPKSRKMNIYDLIRENEESFTKRLLSGGDLKHDTNCGRLLSAETKESRGVPVRKSEALTNIILQDPNSELHTIDVPVKEQVNAFTTLRLVPETAKRSISTEEAQSLAQSTDYEGSGLAVTVTGSLLKSRGKGAHGHASDSSIQFLLYGEGKVQKSKITPIAEFQLPETLETRLSPTKVEIENQSVPVNLKSLVNNINKQDPDITDGVTYEAEIPKEPDLEVPFIKNVTPKTEEVLAEGLLPILFPVVPYEVNLTLADNRKLIDMVEVTKPHVPQTFEPAEDFVHDYLPLSVIVRRSLWKPLVSQINLVNKSITDLFMVELRIKCHFEALRNFLFLNDGEFGQALADLTYDKLASGASPAELLSPVTLNMILSKAFGASLNADEFSEGFSFEVLSIPISFQSSVCSTPFNCINLHYKPPWPVNVVITERSITKYNEIFHFLMRIRHALWALKDIFYCLKKNVNQQKANYSPQFGELQLYRHEMHHLVRAMQAYVASQVLQVSWVELQNNISNNVRNLDDLCLVHDVYLSRAIAKCLLHNRAKPVMKLISRILSMVLKFRTLLVSYSWEVNKQTGLLVHPEYKRLCQTYRVFRDMANSLYGALTDCVSRGSLLFSKELLTMLNFNDLLAQRVEAKKKNTSAAMAEGTKRSQLPPLNRNRKLPPRSSNK